VHVLVPDEHASPAVITIVPDHGVAARTIGDALQRRGWLLAYQSDYLMRRNWLQISVMGHVTRAHFEGLLDALAGMAAARRPADVESDDVRTGT
jgi:aspartate aminotransferase-like enzyme